LFLEAGNIIEADTVCLHFIAYSYLNTNQLKLAHSTFQRINDFCEKRSYKWFLLMNLDWLMGSEESLEHKSFTEIERTYEEALKKAKKIKDNYTTQKFLLSLIRKSDFVKQEKHTLNYLHELLQFSKQPNMSARQKFRNFDKAIPIFALSKFQSFSKEIVLESVSLAEPMSDPLFIISAQINTAIVYMQAENFETSEEWLKAALSNANRLEEKNKQITLAKILLQMGHLERKRGRPQMACGFYDDSLKILEKIDSPILRYETKKSRLAAYQQIGNDSEVEKDIDSTLKLAEEYRGKISDEQDRNKFFDNEQDIYDIAIEHKLRRHEVDMAYNYGETSNSRSLLDWLNRDENISINNQEARIVFNSLGKPLKIDKIMKKIPPTTQLLQYSVLADKVVIWVITREKLVPVWSSINSAELKQEIEKYLKLITEKKPVEDISRKLYTLLITPALPFLDKNKEVCIIPDKVLFKLPFSALLSPDGRYFLEDFTPIYAPSANVFIRSTQKAGNVLSTRNESLLSVGNPAFDPEKFPDLKNLPEAETEARAIAGNYRKATTLIGEDATKSAFQQIYKNFEVIHFAGHYIVQPDLPLFSKLVMAKNPGDENKSLLTNIELIGSRPLRAKLIVLSACQTGIENYSNGEGLIGLSHTFLSLGVPLVVASQWEVDSDASTELMVGFHYFRRQKKLSTSQALRQSQLELLRSQSGRFHSPYFWSGFAVFGGHAKY
jgi:CHAT domain-containing protein